MNSSALKQTELFVFLSFFLLLAVVAASDSRQKDTVEERPDVPPIFTIDESKTWFRFEKSRALIAPEFARALRDSIVPELSALSVTFNCNKIDVIGHTDQVPFYSNSKSNTDRSLYRSAITTDSITDTVRPGSDYDLGGMRAHAVVDQLLLIKREGQYLRHVDDILPYSAAGHIDTSGHLLTVFDPTDSPARRRIEIRLRRE